MGEPLRVVFFCGERSRWGLAHLDPLLEHEHVRLAAVVIATDERWAMFRRSLTGAERSTPALRQRVLGAGVRAAGRLRGDPGAKDPLTLLRHRLRDHGVPLLRIDDANEPAALADFRGHNPDVVLSAAYPQIFGSGFLQEFGGAAYNSHPSLLPRCRGAHPVFWAIASGERRSGGSIHVLTPRLDSGDVVARIPVEITDRDGYRDLYAKLEAIVPELVHRFVVSVREGRTPEPQDETQASTFRNERALDRRLFWTERTARELERLVRAAAGSAFFWAYGTRVAVLRARAEADNRNMRNDPRVPAGTVVDLQAGRPVVATREGFLVLEELASARWRSPRFHVGQVLS